MAFRRLLAPLLIVLTCVSLPGSLCSGWLSSGTAPIPCPHEKHPCPETVTDACCGADEQPQATMSVVASVLTSTPLVPCGIEPFVAPAPSARTGGVSVSSPRVLGSPPDTHLLFSVFLI